MKIGIGLSFYQDFDSLRRMLTSLQAYPIDLIIAIDGKYKGHAARRTLSNAECIDLFKSFQTPYTLDISPNTSQIEKRQRYFDLAIDLDCLIVMDSDEYFIQENTVWDLFVEDLVCKIKENSTTYKQAYCIPTLLKDKGIERIPKGYVENLPRVFYKPSTLTYVEDHFSIQNKETGVLMSYEGNSVCGHIMLGHDHDLRTEEYNRQTQEYEEMLIKEENATRQQKRDEFAHAVSPGSVSITLGGVKEYQDAMQEIAFHTTAKLFEIYQDFLSAQHNNDQKAGSLALVEKQKELLALLKYV